MICEQCLKQIKIKLKNIDKREGEDKRNEEEEKELWL